MAYAVAFNHEAPMPTASHPVHSAALAESVAWSLFQRLGPEGWRLWREIRLQALAEAPSAFGSSLSYWRGSGDSEQRWQDRLRDVALNVVAVGGGHGVGQVSGTKPDDDGEVELISMWVAPSFRSAGIGEGLVREVIPWAREHRAVAVRLTVSKSNTQAIDLYRRHGFIFTTEPAAAEQTMALVLESTPTPW